MFALIMFSAMAAKGAAVPQTVEFTSGALVLRGELYIPDGTGPFPALLFNHGSAPGMQNSHASKAMAPYFMKKGWVFFMPYRRGQGLSSSSGEYIRDEIHKAAQKGMANADQALLRLMTQEHLSDQLAALKWLEGQSFIDKSRIAAFGNSFGGIQTLLGAANANYCAGISASAAAQSWGKAPLLRDELNRAITKSRAPLFIFQAANDYDLEPAKSFATAAANAGKHLESTTYPAFGTTPEQGHSFPYKSVGTWFPDVFRFIERHCVSK
ncbi:MAG: prolyl oligopeptidase family serine peptidase [Myxococcota bacterium]